jgi:hypothetical protein
MDSHPPKPVLALTIGITGHRLHRHPAAGGATPASGPSLDEAKVRAAIDGVLAVIERVVAEAGNEFRDWFAADRPAIALVSSLAEGSDRIAAKAALARSMPLDVVLPCRQARYEVSFSDDGSRQEFKALLDAARATLVLPLPDHGTEEDSLAAAYENAGLTVLAQSDILIAVWDGLPALGRGGTAEIVDEAARQGTPIVVIDPGGAKPHLRWNGDQPFVVPVRHAADLAEISLDTGIAAIVRGLIHPPELTHETDGMRMFFESGAAGAGIQHFGWKLLRWTVGLDRKKRPGATPARHAPSPAETEIHPSSASNRAAEARFGAATSAASRVANDFAHAFRSAFVVNFLLGATAVLFVSLSIVLKTFAMDGSTLRWWHGWLVVGELVCVATVVIYVFIASRQQWHRRWFEAREVTERLRVAQPFWRLGVWPHNLAFHQPAWTGWYMRAILREMPVYSRDLSASLRDAKAVLWNMIDDQIDYHRRTMAEMKHLDHCLEIVGMVCLVVTVTVAVVFFIGGIFLFDWELSNRDEAVITALAVFLPALATAAYGIRLIGDFEDSVHRSGHTLALLEALDRNLEKSVDNLPELRTCARLAADAMLADVESWRVAVESRNLGAA